MVESLLVVESLLMVEFACGREFAWGREFACGVMGHQIDTSDAPSHRQDSTYHGLCNTSHGALPGTRNSSMGSP